MTRRTATVLHQWRGRSPRPSSRSLTTKPRRKIAWVHEPAELAQTYWEHYRRSTSRSMAVHDGPAGDQSRIVLTPSSKRRAITTLATIFERRLEATKFERSKFTSPPTARRPRRRRRADNRRGRRTRSPRCAANNGFTIGSSQASSWAPAARMRAINVSAARSNGDTSKGVLDTGRGHTAVGRVDELQLHSLVPHGEDRAVEPVVIGKVPITASPTTCS